MVYVKQKSIRMYFMKMDIFASLSRETAIGICIDFINYSSPSTKW